MENGLLAMLVEELHAHSARIAAAEALLSKYGEDMKHIYDKLDSANNWLRTMVGLLIAALLALIGNLMKH